MLLDLLFIGLGFVGLTWGANLFVFGASALARNLGVSPLFIGLTIVAFGTSAPEFFSSAVASLNNEGELAVGNALGSNLFNVGIALGVAAMVSPLTPPPTLMRKEIAAMLLVTVITGVLIIDGHWSRYDAVALIAVVIVFIAVFAVRRLTSPKAEIEPVKQLEELQIEAVSNLKAVFYSLVGLGLLVVSSQAMVVAASSIAAALGVGTGVIGLTVVALGTSLPELALSITCAVKDEDELAIGNILGSNIMNLLVVLPFPGLLMPGGLALESRFVYLDYPATLLICLVLSLFCYTSIKRGTSIGRFGGLCLLLIYCGWFSLMLLNT